MLVPSGSQHFPEYSVKKRISTGYVGIFGQPIFTEYSVKCRICWVPAANICKFKFTEYSSSVNLKRFQRIRNYICWYLRAQTGQVGSQHYPYNIGTREFVGTYGKPTFYRVVGKI